LHDDINYDELHENIRKKKNSWLSPVVRSSTELKFCLGLHILRIVWLPKHLHQRKQGFISYICKQHIVTHNGEKCFKEACECQQNWWSTELLLPPEGFGSGGDHHVFLKPMFTITTWICFGLCFASTHFHIPFAWMELLGWK